MVSFSGFPVDKNINYYIHTLLNYSCWGVTSLHVPNTTIKGQILLCKVVNIGPGSMWILELHNLKAIRVSRRRILHTETSVRSHFIIQCKNVHFKGFCLFRLEWKQSKSQSSKRRRHDSLHFDTRNQEWAHNSKEIKYKTCLAATSLARKHCLTVS